MCHDLLVIQVNKRENKVSLKPTARGMIISLLKPTFPSQFRPSVKHADQQQGRRLLENGEYLFRTIGHES